MDKIKDKIQKLLALSVNPNENEAKQALLKARELMAKYKLSEQDIEVKEKSNVITKELPDITFTKISDVWVEDLLAITAQNYCCASLVSHSYGAKRYSVSFVGFPDDIEIAENVFRYAYHFVLNRTKEIRKEFKGKVPAVKLRNMCNHYGWGFCSGLNEMFTLQNSKCQETGLILVVPKEVTDITDVYKDFEGSNVSQNPDSLAAEILKRKGYEQGLNFVPNRSIQETY